jgi:glycine cleavage system H lipoate-binding protein/TusA-related sulfurtransferase
VKLGGCEYREDVLYDPEFGTWGRLEEGLWRVGVTPLLPWLSGGLTAVTFKPAGARIAQGNSIASVEGPRHFEVVRAPFDCVVKETNGALTKEPRTVNRDPFGDGWLALVEKASPGSRLEPLAGAAPAIEQRHSSMKVRCFAAFPDIELYEVGTECSAVLSRLDEELANSPRGAVVHLVSDDPTAEIEMMRWEGQTGNALLEVRPEGALRHFIVKKS